MVVSLSVWFVCAKAYFSTNQSFQPTLLSAHMWRFVGQLDPYKELWRHNTRRFVGLAKLEKALHSIVPANDQIARTSNLQKTSLNYSSHMSLQYNSNDRFKVGDYISNTQKVF